jgi:hypothetical protein
VIASADDPQAVRVGALELQRPELAKQVRMPPQDQVTAEYDLDLGEAGHPPALVGPDRSDRGAEAGLLQFAPELLPPGAARALIQAAADWPSPVTSRRAG